MLKRLSLFVITILLIGLIVGCGEKTTSSDDDDGKITIALLPKKKGMPYFTSCAEGAQAAADELGDVVLIYDGPTDGSPEKAAAMIELWILKGVDVIAVSPNDPAVVGPAMERARAKGIKVVTWDADADADAREFFINQATAQDIGFALVDVMVQDLGGSGVTGDVAIITAALTAANQTEWIKHMRVRLKDYPGLKLVATKPAGENQALALSIAKDLMKAYPDLKGIFAISSAAFPGAAEAVKQAGRVGEVMVTGLSPPNSMRACVKDGTVKSVILWNTKDLGYLTVYAARALVKGDLKPGDTTFIAGRLGERKIEGDNIMLGDMLIFTIENIDDFDF